MISGPATDVRGVAVGRGVEDWWAEQPAACSIDTTLGGGLCVNNHRSAFLIAATQASLMEVVKGRH